MQQTTSESTFALEGSALPPRDDRSWPVSDRLTDGRQPAHLDLGSLGDLKSIVNLNSEVSNGTLELGMPEQQLHYPKVLGPPVNQGGLRTPHRVRPVRRFVKPDLPNPAVNDPAVLPGR